MDFAKGANFLARRVADLAPFSPSVHCLYNGLLRHQGLSGVPSLTDLSKNSHIPGKEDFKHPGQ